MKTKNGKTDKDKKWKLFTFSIDKETADMIDRYFKENPLLNKSKSVSAILKYWIQTQQ